MIRWMVAAAGLLLAACGAPKADALGVFGSQDNFDIIQPVTVPEALRPEMPAPWAKGADLVRHSQTMFIGAGVWVTDKGYALKMHGSDKYIQLDDRKIAAFQQVGLLPKPFPKGDIAPTTWLVGYSLWILLGALALFLALSPTGRQRFFASLAAQTGRAAGPAPQPPIVSGDKAATPDAAPAWRTRATAMMSEAASAPNTAAASRPKPRPTYQPMVEGGSRGFGRKR